jgi:hypothetical protein
MNDDDLRALTRQAIRTHMGGSPGAPVVRPNADAAPGIELPLSISFGQYRLERAKDDTACLIEPAVQCNHCGFCKCHGH